jgi:predicted ATP-dependent protease
VIPGTNVRHLMLRKDVVEAVRDGTFHVHAVSTVDEGLEILSGRPAGERAEPRAPFPAGSFNAAIEQALADNLERLRALRTNSHGVALTGSGSG